MAESRDSSKDEVLKTIMEMESVDILYDIRTLLRTVVDQTRPFDHNEVLEIDVGIVHSLTYYRFDDTVSVKRITVMPVPREVTIWVNSTGDSNKFLLQRGESVIIERPCNCIYYSNEAYTGEDEKVRIHCDGHYVG